MLMKLITIFVIYFCELSFSLQHEIRLRKRNNIPARIIGGTATTIEEIGGFLVALRFNQYFICGGSYIANRIILTAAHCIHERMEHLNNITVEGGITKLTDKVDKVKIIGALIPQDFNPATNEMDLAVALLKRSLRNSKIRTVGLCTRKYHSGDLAQVSGWGFGYKSSRKPMLQVRSVDVPVISHKKCKKIYSKLNVISKTMLCAGSPDKDSCTYDSGGPLLIQGELCGIVSFGVGCAHAVYPGVYVDVRNVHKFIERSKTELRRLMKD